MKTSTNPDRIKVYLNAIPGAVAGARGHNQTFTVAVALVNGFALGESEALEWLTKYNQKCDPSWSDKELLHKIKSAMAATHKKPRGHLLNDRKPGASVYKNVSTTKRPERAKAKPLELAAKENVLPTPIKSPTIELLKAAFREGESICIEPAIYTESDLQTRLDDDASFEGNFMGDCVREKEWPPARPSGRSMFKTREQWLKIFTKSPDSFAGGGLPGVFVVLNPFPAGTKQRTNDDVEQFRHVLLEFDTISKEAQWSVIRDSNVPCSAIIDSGGKSVHAWVRVDAGTREQYAARAQKLFEMFETYQPDTNCGNPARLSRLAGARRHVAVQSLLAVDVGAKSFVDWAAGKGDGEEAEEEETYTPFPVHCLPNPYQEMATEIARITQTPIALAGCSMLGLLASSIGRGLKVQSGNNRETYGNIYILASAGSGSGKSETSRYAFAPFREFEKSLSAKWADETEPRLKAEKEVKEGQIKQLKRKAEKADSETAEGFVEKLAKLNADIARIDKELLASRLSVENVTVEKLAVLLEANGESISLISSDGREVVSNLLGRNNQLKQVDDGILIKMFSGDTCRVDRIGREAVTLKEPIGNVFILIQPDRFNQLISHSEIREGGLLPRFLTCHTNAQMEYETDDPAPIDSRLVQQFDLRVQQLLKVFRIPGGKGNETTVSMDFKGRKLLKEFKNSIVAKVKRGLLSDVQSFAARYAEQAWKLCVTFHAGRWGDDATKNQIDEETASNAIELAQWFAEQQLQILFNVREAARKEIEDKVLELFGKLPDGITPRDVSRARITTDAKQAQPLLESMVASGVLKSETVATGGRSKTIYTVKGQ
jgi:hypothetical protein